ncbi:MAG: mycofactocin precursor MftA [Acidimicrobiales bacterium]
MGTNKNTTAITTGPSEHADEIVDDMLIEEISIDGMCGVY